MTASEDYMFVTSESICVAFANMFAEVAVVALLAVDARRGICQITSATYDSANHNIEAQPPCTAPHQSTTPAHLFNYSTISLPANVVAVLRLLNAG